MQISMSQKYAELVDAHKSEVDNRIISGGLESIAATSMHTALSGHTGDEVDPPQKAVPEHFTDSQPNHNSARMQATLGPGDLMHPSAPHEASAAQVSLADTGPGHRVGDNLTHSPHPIFEGIFPEPISELATPSKIHGSEFQPVNGSTIEGHILKQRPNLLAQKTATSLTNDGLHPDVSGIVKQMPDTHHSTALFSQRQQQNSGIFSSFPKPVGKPKGLDMAVEILSDGTTSGKELPPLTPVDHRHHDANTPADYHVRHAAESAGPHSNQEQGHADPSTMPNRTSHGMLDVHSNRSDSHDTGQILHSSESNGHVVEKQYHGHQQHHQQQQGLHKQEANQTKSTKRPDHHQLQPQHEHKFGQEQDVQNSAEILSQTVHQYGQPALPTGVPPHFSKVPGQPNNTHFHAGAALYASSQREQIVKTKQQAQFKSRMESKRLSRLRDRQRRQSLRMAQRAKQRKIRLQLKQQRQWLKMQRKLAKQRGKRTHRNKIGRPGEQQAEQHTEQKQSQGNEPLQAQKQALQIQQHRQQQLQWQEHQQLLHQQQRPQLNSHPHPRLERQRRHPQKVPHGPS